LHLIGLQRGVEIYADSAEQKSIEELRRGMWTDEGEFLDGFYVQKAIKGAGSRVEGVSKVSEYEVYMVKTSKNLIRENRSYQFVMVGGKVTNEPMDGEDHLLDGLRYAVYTRYHPRMESFGGGDNS